MGSKSKGRISDKNNNNSNVIGKGKITPVQVAFIVDRYLVDNNFVHTRSTFRSEAASLISKSSLNQVPKSLMSLGEMLEEYIMLKEQKVAIEQEKCRIQSLLYGMQNVMNDYNLSTATTAACLTPPPPPVSGPSPPVHVTPSSVEPASGTQVTTSVSTTQCVKIDRANFRTPVSDGRPPRKRRNDNKALEDAPHASKKVYSGPLANYPFSSKVVDKAVEQPSNTSSTGVAKALFDKRSESPTSNSSGPKTPPQAASPPSEKSTRPSEDVSSTPMSSHQSISPPESTPTNCTIFSSKTIIVSPAKRYSIETNECTFSSPAKTNVKRQNERNNVKGRLNFDSSDVPSCSTSESSEKEGDIFDLDLTSLDAFGPDFSLNELLTEFGIHCDNVDYPCPMTACTSSDPIAENDGQLSSSRDLFQHSSAMTEVVAANDTVNGSDSINSMKSVRQCIRIVTPTKRTRNTSVHCQEII